MVHFPAGFLPSSQPPTPPAPPLLTPQLSHLAFDAHPRGPVLSFLCSHRSFLFLTFLGARTQGVPDVESTEFVSWAQGMVGTVVGTLEGKERMPSKHLTRAVRFLYVDTYDCIQL